MKKERFPIELIAARTQKGLTQADLAEAIGVSERSVSLWERGKVIPRIGIRMTLAHYLLGKDQQEITAEGNFLPSPDIQVDKRILTAPFLGAPVCLILLTKTGRHFLKRNHVRSHPYGNSIPHFSHFSTEGCRIFRGVFVIFVSIQTYFLPYFCEKFQACCGQNEKNAL